MWRYALTTNATIFCALRNNIPMGCLDAVITELLVRRSEVNCLFTNGYGETYNDYLCFFRAVAVHLYGSAELETKAAKLFSEFLQTLVMMQLTLEECQWITLCLLKKL